MNSNNRTVLLLVGIFFASTFTTSVIAEDRFSGDVTVAGTLKARDLRVGNEAIATQRALENLRKEILAEVVSEISKKLNLVATLRRCVPSPIKSPRVL